MYELDTIERVSWWNTNSKALSREMSKVSRLMVNETGELLPPGRAFVNGLDPEKS